MSETRTVHDPFLNKEVEVSNRLTDRLRGKYACGPIMANGEPEFGWRQMPTVPIQVEAAAEIERLTAIIEQCAGLMREVAGANRSIHERAPEWTWNRKQVAEEFDRCEKSIRALLQGGCK